MACGRSPGAVRMALKRLRRGQVPRETSLQRLARFLGDGRSHLRRECVTVVNRGVLAVSVQRLRQRGFVIDVQRLSHDETVYRMVSVPSEAA